jgi:hypothetical protein
MGYEVVVLAFSSEDGPIWTMRPSFVIALPHLEWVDASRPSVETISSFEEGSKRYLWPQDTRGQPQHGKRR